ncbi:MAG: hypothetical protein AAFN30_06840 [Actinomycetota bacterium]
MHVAVTPLGSTPTSVAAKVIVAGLDDDRPHGLTLAVDGAARPLDTWQSIGDDATRIWYANHRRDDLEPGRSYQIELRIDGEPTVRAEAATLPQPGRPFGLIFGSCFDSDQSRAAVRVAYDELARRQAERAAPTMNLWLGDQVYLDAPWQRTILPVDPEPTILAKYARAWDLTPQAAAAEELRAGDGGEGDDPAAGLAHAMTQAANWYLPDDHEFWNGYPHPSFLTLPFHTAGHLLVQIMRWFTTGPDRPSHPHVQGRWGRFAGEAYCAFQTDLDFNAFGEDVNPPQLQRIDLGPVLIVMADTRWHRTIRKSGDRSAFMLDEDLQALTDLLESEDRLVCLCLARSVAGHLPDDGPIRDKIVYDPEDYSRQYVPLWQALNDRAADGRPTLVLGGDLHAQAVTTVLGDRLLEVVSSPLALLVALDSELAMTLRRAWRWTKTGLRALLDRLRGRPPVPAAAYPVTAADGSWSRAVGRAVLPERTVISGAASVTFDTTDSARPAVIVDVVRVDDGRPEVWSRQFRWDDGWVGAAP